MSTVALAAPTRSAPPVDVPAAHRWPSLVLFVTAFTGYTAIGLVLALHYDMIDADAASRVANAGYVLNSRYPHLSALGFVWNPLPSLVELPMLRLRAWWPALMTHALAGVFQSALFMAGTAVLIRRIAMDRGLGPLWRWIAVACFVLHPMIVIYGGSGMSEAAELFFAVWAVRRLLLWIELGRAGDLAWVGIALGLGYLARYEFIPAAAGAACLVGVTAFRRAPSGKRRDTALLSVLVVVFPLTMALIGWALIGWLISEDLFAQFTSQYGNASLVTQFAEHRPRQVTPTSAWLIGARLLGMQPLVMIAVAIAVGTSLIRRRPEHLAAPAIIGPILLFAAWGQYTWTTFGWFRYYLLAVPLVICIAMVFWSIERPAARLARCGAVLLTASLVIGFPITIAAMLDRRIGGQQLQLGLLSIVSPNRYPADEQWNRRLLVDDRALAEYFDEQRLPDGAVLMDSFSTWGVWLTSDHQRQFVITSDYDFRVQLNHPREFGIRYIVVSNPADSANDAVSWRYPDLWDDGADIGELVYSVGGTAGQERFRIYRVFPRPGSSAPRLPR